jgi:glycerol-3-phosphate dehydrogenase
MLGARDLDRLTGTRYDLLVVGGGIHGVAIAYEAATRGLRIGLVEAGDFGGGTSFNHQKTAHGGLRSLQSGRLDRARHAIVERRALARMAPWLLRPLPFIVGTYRSLTRGRLALRAAFAIDKLLGRDRNAEVEPELHLPAPRLLSRTATLHLFPGVRQAGLTGGAQWYDYQMVENDRLTLAFLAGAIHAGADAVNYASAVSPVREGGRISGMVVRDALTGRDVEVAARAVVNAAGAQAGRIMHAVGVSRPYPLLKAMNLVTTRPASDIALAAPTASGRMLTLVPWRARAIVGTSQSATLVGPEDTGVTPAEIDAFIAEANDAFPALRLSRGDVTLVHRGLVPATGGNTPQLRASPEVIDHAREGAAGAFTVIGVKYTTARGVAERTVDTVARALGVPVKRSRSATTVLPGAGIGDHEALAIETSRAAGIELAPETTRRLTRVYAEGVAEIVRLIAERPALAERLTSDTDTIAAEVVHAIRREMAVRLADVVIRRTGLGAAGHPGTAPVAACAAIAARELGWDQARATQEILAVDAFYNTD